MMEEKEGENFSGTPEEIARVDQMPGACTAKVGSDGVLRLFSDATGEEIPLVFTHYPQEGEEPGPVSVPMEDKTSELDAKRIEKLKRFASMKKAD